MKRLSTFLVFAFLGIAFANAQSDVLYVVGENDATPGNAPTLYVQGQGDVYVQGGVVASSTNTRTSHDGLLQVAGTLHIGNNAGVGSTGNWTNSTGAAIYTYNTSSLPAANTYAPSATSITYGLNANTVSLEFGNQLITGTSPSATTYFFNLSLLDGATNSPAVHSFKTMAGADIYVGVTSLGWGVLDLNDERLVTQDNIVHVLNPSTTTTGTSVAISRLYDPTISTANLENAAPFTASTNSGMIIAGNVGATQTHGRVSRVTNSTNTYSFPVGSLVSIPLGYGSGENYDNFAPAEIIPSVTTAKEFAVSLQGRDGFADAGTAMDQGGTTWHNLAGINHGYYYKINQTAGSISNSDQIRLYHLFTSNSTANSFPNWSTCGNLPASDFPQTLTIAQYDNNGTNLSWNDVCHGGSSFVDFAASCGAVTVAPNNDFCSNTITNPPPTLSSTTTVAYQTPGSYIGISGSAQEDYTVAGLFFTVDGGNGSCDGNCATLPLNIISLNGWNEGSQNHVQWLTQNEENIDYYAVEKSIDGVNFTEISDPSNHVTAVSNYMNKETTYDFYDKEPNMGNNYYRIRQVTYNMQFVLTNVINVPLTKAITIAKVYPNPVTNKLNVDFETATAGSVHVEIYDVLGRLIMSNDNAVNQGNNTINLNTSMLTAGSYFIRITDTSSSFTDTQKFIKITE